MEDLLHELANGSNRKRKYLQDLIISDRDTTRDQLLVIIELPDEILDSPLFIALSEIDP